MTNVNTRSGNDITEDTREIHPAVITWALVIGLVVAFVVTASSFKLSFTTLLDLGSMAGLRDSAWVIPVVLDGPILAASILRIALSQHTDRRTVLGRRFIIAVYALAGVASMAGNAYHAVLTVTDLNAAVAAAMGALAPLMVMTMAEMMSVAISAPRRRVVEMLSTTTEPVDVEAAATDFTQHLDPDQSAASIETPVVDEDVDNGLLKPAVWASVHLWLTKPQWSNSDIARELGIHTSTVGRHVKLWTDVQAGIAQKRSIEHMAGVPQNENADVEDDAGGDESVQNYGDTGVRSARRDDDENESPAEAATYAYAGSAG